MLPRELNDAGQQSLRALAQQVMAQLDLRWVIDELRDNLQILERYEDQIEAYKKHVKEINAQALDRRAVDENSRGVSLILVPTLALNHSR